MPGFPASLSILLLTAAAAAAAVAPNPVFRDNMVLQRDRPVPVWGTANPREHVTIEFRGQSKSADSDEAGRWRVLLDPLKAEPDQAGSDLVIRGSASAVTFLNVLSGDVWMVPGGAAAAGTQDAGDPLIRIMIQGGGPEDSGWTVGTSRAMSRINPLALAFAKGLRKDLNVPLGLLTTGTSGTSLAPWVPMDFLQGEPGLSVAADAARDTLDQGAKQPAAPPSVSYAPGELFDRDIAVLAPFAVRGVLWDQGGAGSGLAGPTYAAVFEALLKGWRKTWAAEIPFIFPQIPRGGGWGPNLVNKDGAALPLASLPPNPPAPKDLRLIGDFLREMTNLPGVHMAVTFDLPKEGQPNSTSLCADRLVLTALDAVYGSSRVISEGPSVSEVAAEGNKVRVRFNNAEGLQAMGKPTVQGFALAGDDGRFEWAKATLDGPSVVLSVPGLSAPRQVSYAWAPDARWANLFNGAALPAQRFLQPVPPPAAPDPQATPSASPSPTTTPANSATP